MQKEFVKVYLCPPRAFWKEVGLETRCLSFTLKTVAGAQFVAFVGLLLVVALFLMRINFRLVLELSLLFSSVSPGHVSPWTQQAKQAMHSQFVLDDT